jgi:hypothetical protein
MPHCPAKIDEFVGDFITYIFPIVDVGYCIIMSEIVRDGRLI